MFNSSSWASAALWLESHCPPSVMLVVLVETKLLPGDPIGRAAIRAAALGWKGVWAPALPSPTGHGASGGIAILGRGGVRLTAPPRPWADAVRLAETHRVALALAHAEGLGDFAVAGVYLHCSEAWSQRNRELVLWAAHSAQSFAPRVVVAGDLQSEPTHRDSLLTAELARLHLVAPAEHTLHAPARRRTIDWAFMSPDLAASVAATAVCTSVAPNPHVPVVVHFHAAPSTRRRRVVEQLPHFPHSPPVGPAPALGPCLGRVRPSSWPAALLREKASAPRRPPLQHWTLQQGCGCLTP